MRLNERTIEQVRERANIVDLMEGRTLKKAGREFVTHCPWHDDHSPSLTVSPNKNFAFCHVCAKGVDPIGWLQDQEGLNFTDAVIKLANRYGIEVEAANEEDSKRYAQEQQRKAALYKQREVQREEFHEALWSSPGFEYMLGRDVAVETLDEWKIGWNGSRVMFPLNDAQGRTVAFTGRVIDDSKPKYKNSQNDELYNKSEMVFGLDKAKEQIVKSGQVVITEGQMDVIMCHQYGISNMVAVSGASLTKGMVERLVKTTKCQEVVLCFDGDLGGMKAADRALRELQEIVLRGELNLKILTMPEGCDPADLADGMRDLIAEAPHWVEWWLEREVGKVDLSNPQEIAKAEEGIKRILKVLPKGGLREYVQRRSKELIQAVPDVAPAKVKTQKQIDKCRWAERRAVRLYLLEPMFRDAIRELNLKDGRCQKIIEVAGMIEGLGVNPPELATVLQSVVVRDEDLYDELRPLVNPIPEVLRVIQKAPDNEMEGVLSVLLSDCCQPSDSDR